MAMQKGFLAAGAGPQLTSSSGGSSKKKKSKEPKKSPNLNDIYAVPGAGAAREKAMKKRDVLDYSRFDSIGAREAKKDQREEALKQIPPGLRGRLGKQGEDMVLDMAEKMKTNPELRPSPEEVVQQLQQEKDRTEKERYGGNAKAKSKSVPVAMPRAVTPDDPSAPLSAKIDSARGDFEQQMEQMRLESERLEQQQARLKKMAGDGGPEELLTFLAEQGCSEEDMQVMMSDPVKGMAMLQQAMQKGLGLDTDGAQMAETAMKQMETVDDVTAQLKALASADTKADVTDIVDIETPAFSGSGGRKPAKARKAKRGGAKPKPGSQAAEIQRQIEEAERQMQQAQLNADNAAAEHKAMEATAAKVKAELAAVEAEKERAGAEIDAQTANLRERGDNAGAEEILGAKADAEQAAAAAASGSASSRPVARHSVTEVGSPATGVTSLKLEVKLPLVASFTEVELELTETEVRLSCDAYAPLTIELKYPVDPDGAAAKFSKKSHKLRVELPIVGGVPMPAQGQML